MHWDLHFNWSWSVSKWTRTRIHVETGWDSPFRPVLIQVFRPAEFYWQQTNINEPNTNTEKFLFPPWISENKTVKIKLLKTFNMNFTSLLSRFRIKNKPRSETTWEDKTWSHTTFHKPQSNPEHSEDPTPLIHEDGGLMNFRCHQSHANSEATETWPWWWNFSSAE